MAAARIQTQAQTKASKKTAADFGRSGLPAALDVSVSLTGKRWEFSAFDERAALGMAQTHGVPEIIGRLLAIRGVGFEAAADFLSPSLKMALPNPSWLKDMDKAADRIARAIMQGEKVAVFGDYDVDGATSTALLRRFFRAVGGDILVYIPDRIKEGYGPNAPALLRMKEAGVSLVITVDCGITAFEPLQAAQDAGLDVIVLDHHEAEPKLPPAYAVVNPNRLDEDGSLAHLAAVGVTFLAIVAVNRSLRAAGFYAARSEPRLTQWLDLVALGTVCDVVPLHGLNRAYVSQGLKVLALRQNPGLRALADKAGLAETPAAWHLGFLLGPRVNAGGRVGEADCGTTLLSTDDAALAAQLAARLDQYNRERQQIENAVLEEAVARAESQRRTVPFVMVAGEGWHPGVIGIVAGRLKERYNCPACVVAFDENGMGKASGRSVSGIDLGSAVIAARQKGLLVNGGGHAMAAGFTVTRASYEAFHDFMAERIMAAVGDEGYVPRLRIDSTLSASGVTLELAEKLDLLAPYGQGNPEPRFVLPRVQIIKADVVGEKHIRCVFRDAAGGSSVKGIAFRAVGTPLGDALLSRGQVPLHLAGQVSINRWQGSETVQFQIADAAPAWE